MAKLPGGFSPTAFIKQAGSYLNPTGGVADYDVFSDLSVRGGERSPTSGAFIGGGPTTSTGLSNPIPAFTIDEQGGPGGGGAVGGASTGGGGGGGIAGAQNAQQVASLRNEIIARRDRANSIFDALTGAVSALAAEKRGQLESQFEQESGQAASNYGETSGQISRAYRGRGLGDSSYRINALDKASQDYQRTVQDLTAQRGSGLAKVGAEATGVLARAQADRESLGGIRLDEVGRRDDGTYDVNKLVELRNDLDNRIREASVQQTELGTEAGFRGKLDQIAPYGGTTNALKASLNSLLQAAVPKVVKDRLAAQLIGTYAPTDATVWQEYYDEQSQKQPVAA